MTNEETAVCVGYKIAQLSLYLWLLFAFYRLEKLLYVSISFGLLFENNRITAPSSHNICF